MLDATTSMIQYRGDGAQSVFPIPFPFQETAHIHARVSEGMATRRLSPGVDFAVSRNSGATGELVLLGDALPAGQLLTLRRLLPLTQEILFHNQGPNSPQAIEEAVDKLTMISQQLQAAVEICVQAPDAETAAELADSAAANASRVAAVENSLSAKADKNHAHAQSEIPGLAAALAGKADADATTQALAGKASLAQLAAKADLAAVSAKADRSELSAKADASQLALKADKTALADKADRTALAGKADSVHRHAVDAVDGLAAALASKLDADDPRLDLIGSGGGGAADHAQLENRDAADQHPQAAITNLTGDLAAIRGDLAERGEADDELFDHIETLAARTDELAAHTDELAARADGLGGRLASVETGVETLGGGLDGVGETIGAQGAEIAALGTRMTSAETNDAGMRTEMTEMKTEVTEMRTDVTDVRTEVTAAENTLASVAVVLERLTERLVALEENPGGTGGGTPPPAAGGGIIGDIRLLPFRADALPGGWHFCDGAVLLLSSPVGQALASLPESFKTDWGITSGSDTITLPDLFDGETGGGVFLRGVNGAERLPGSAQGDAIRNITGSFTLSPTSGLVRISSTGPSTLTGAFTTNTGLPPRGFGASQAYVGDNVTGHLLFDASLSVPTAEENRPVNVGMTPAIYLGV